MYVYVIVWFAVVFGINSVSNAGRKIVIVQGAVQHYYTSLRALLIQILQQITLLQINPT